MVVQVDRASRPIYVLPTEAVEGDKISRTTLAGALGYLWDGRYWLLVFGLLGLGAGVAVDLIQSRWYHSQTLLIAAQADRNASSLLGSVGSSLGGLASLAGINLNAAGGNRQEALTVLQSPGFLGGFIERHQLMPVLYAKIWDADNKTWKVDDSKKVPTLADTVVYFQTRILTVADDQKTGVITVAVEWKDRFLAAQWANMLVDELNETLRNRAVKESNDSVGYLNSVLRQDTVSEAQRQAIYNLIESQMASQTVANVRKQYALKVLDRALASDERRFVRPNLIILVVGGTFLAMVFGLALRAVVWPRLRARFGR